MPLVTQAAFADISNVSRQAVGDWIKTGKITAPALTGTGRQRRIDVELAQKQMRSRRDPGQALGNGAHTVLTSPEPEVAPQKDVTVDILWAIIKELHDTIAWHLTGFVPIHVAYFVHFAMRLDITSELRFWGCKPPGDLNDPDWTSLAEEEYGGAPVDLKAWQTWAEEKAWGESEEIPAFPVLNPTVAKASQHQGEQTQ